MPPLAIRIVLSVCAAAAMAAACGRTQPAGPSTRPNILLVTVDTLRADRVGAGVAPAIDRLAASGTRFTSARTTAPMTLPAHATVHTGLLPPEHGVRENGAGSLAPSHRTIAMLLKASGYRTAAFVGAFVLDRRFGLAQGFDTYDDQIPRDPNATERLEAERPASAVIDRALTWLRTPGPKGPGLQPNDSPVVPQSPSPPAPFFLWVHLYDPHAPYTPPPEFAARAKTPYDGEVAYADSQLARLFDALRTSGVLDRTLVVFAGDHGEGLGDHGERTHGMLLYDSTLRVPLVFAAPGRAPSTVDEAVSLSEVAPTILRAAGVTPPPEMKGRNLLTDVTVRLKPDTTDTPTTNSGSVRLQPDLYSETGYPHVAGWSPLQALTDGRWKVIRAGSATEVYDVRSDPREERDLAASQASLASAMSARADAIHGSATTASTAVPADVQERLRALGYVAGSGTARPAGAPNPARSIAAWNEFEDALGMLAAHQPSAVEALRKLAAANPDAPVMQTTYARALRESGRAVDALAVYRSAARRWPTDATLLHDLAAAARDAAAAAKSQAAAQSLRDEAVRAERAALVLQPESATARNGLGLLAIDEGRTADAASSFERAAALDPNNASYWANLGNARRAAGDRALAEQAYRRALDVDARSADAANGLGVLLVEANRPADAAPWFERAIASAPAMVEARLNLGIALQSAGDLQRAAEQYRLVLAADGHHPREKDAAAKLLAALGASR